MPNIPSEDRIRSGYNLVEQMIKNEKRMAFTMLDFDNFYHKFKVAIYERTGHNAIALYTFPTYQDAVESYREIKKACRHAVDNEYITT